MDHPVVPQGNEPPPLLCDSTCEATQRRAQLANAFGIADPDSHVAVADRSRIVTHSPELLAYAREHKNWVEDVRSRFLDSFLYHGHESFHLACSHVMYLLWPGLNRERFGKHQFFGCM